MDYHRSIVKSDGQLYGTTALLCGSQYLQYRVYLPVLVLLCKLKGNDKNVNKI